MNEKLHETISHYNKIADELEIASKHFRIAANHFKENNIPRACAHAFAGYGNMNNASDILKIESQKHAEESLV